MPYHQISNSQYDPVYNFCFNWNMEKNPMLVLLLVILFMTSKEKLCKQRNAFYIGNFVGFFFIFKVIFNDEKRKYHQLIIMYHYFFPRIHKYCLMRLFRMHCDVTIFILKVCIVIFHMTYEKNKFVFRMIWR